MSGDEGGGPRGTVVEPHGAGRVWRAAQHALGHGWMEQGIVLDACLKLPREAWV